MLEDDRRRRSRVVLYDDLPEAVVEELNLPSHKLRDETGLSRIEQEFCFRWTSHYDAARAAIEAGYRPFKAHLIARRLLTEPRIKRQVAVIESDRLRRLRFDGDEYLAREIQLATASATELVELWIPPCRYCWGRNYEYQRTHAEFQEAWDDWMRLPDQRSRRGGNIAIDLGYGQVLVYDEAGGKIPFDQKGGDGYDVSQPPNPACPNCHGRGLENVSGSLPYIKLKDTRELSDVGKMLYAGVKKGARGIEQLTHNQDAARTRLTGLIGRFLELRALGQVPAGTAQPALGFRLGVSSSVADLLTDDPRSMSNGQLDSLLLSYGVNVAALDEDGPDGERTASEAADGEAPPPGRIA